MSRLISFGAVSEETQGRYFSTVQSDGWKKIDTDLLLYRASDLPSDNVKIQDDD